MDGANLRRLTGLIQHRAPPHVLVHRHGQLGARVVRIGEITKGRAETQGPQARIRVVGHEVASVVLRWPPGAGFLRRTPLEEMNGASEILPTQMNRETRLLVNERRHLVGHRWIQRQRHPFLL